MQLTLPHQKVLSTGLLVIRTTDVVVDSAILTRTAVFDTDLWNRSSFAFGAESVSLWSGIHRENLTQPSWTGDTFAVEPFIIHDGKVPSNLTYSAVTNGLYPALDCDEARFLREPTYWNSLIDFRQANVTFRTSTCDTDQTLVLADPTQRDRRQNKWAAENFMGVVREVNCSGVRHFLITVTQADNRLNIVKYR